ncbi:COG4223 family protein [Amaricoccus tamworthensis]|uniref:COG4223 family protein n=1 Tax=Amaricoccus tamworthensis TaxID=57002 RepID=UPI003C7ED86E
MVSKKTETGDDTEDKNTTGETSEDTVETTSANDIFGESDDTADGADGSDTDGENIFTDSLDDPDGTPGDDTPDATNDTVTGDTDDSIIDELEHSEDPIALVEDDTPAPVEEPETSEPEPVEEPSAQPEHDAHHDEYEEVHQPSFASRALKFLVLLLIGAAIGIWGAPKIAPHLPSGMAPVANWLTPGTNSTLDRIAELEARVDSELNAVTTEVAELVAVEEVDIEGVVASAIAGLATETDAKIAELEATMADLDIVSTRQTLARLESTVEGQISELGAMKEQLSGGIAESSELSSEAVAQIDVYRAELEGLRGELGSLSDQVSALASRIDEVAATADRSINAAQAKVDEIQSDATEALSAAAIEADAAQVAAALSSAQPFAEPVSRLEAGGITVPEGLAGAAETGAPTLLMLRESFPDAAHDAIRATIMATAAEEGFIGRSKAYLEAQVATRSLTPQDGMDPDAVLSRMEDRLRNDDLAGALAEAEKLPTEALDAMSGWLQRAEARAAADQGLAELRSSLPAVN